MSARDRRAGDLDERLARAARALDRALEAAAAADAPLEAAEDRARRAEAAAREAAASAVRIDLLGLNAQVEAARLGDEGAGLERVADEVRALADQGTHGAAEQGELAAQGRAEVAAARGAWRRALLELESVRAHVEAAQGRADELGQSLADARVAARGPAPSAASPDGDLLGATDLRAATLVRLARSVARYLRRTGDDLLAEAAMADEAAAGVEALERGLQQARALVDGADDLARRSKQLAVNADLAAARAADPALVLFAEEARRLGEQAETTGAAGNAQLARALETFDGARDRLRRHADALRGVAQDLASALARFAEPDDAPDGDAHEDLAQAWRDDRAAARRLLDARRAAPAPVPVPAPDVSVAPPAG